MKYIYIIAIIINIIYNIYSEKIDLSDKNPIVFCLQKIKNYNIEEIKDFILQNQDPEYAIENYPSDKDFSNCIEQMSRNNL